MHSFDVNHYVFGYLLLLTFSFFVLEALRRIGCDILQGLLSIRGGKPEKKGKLVKSYLRKA